MNKFYLVIITAIIILGMQAAPALADSVPAAPETGDSEEVYVYPKLAPETSLTLGYRHVDLKGSTRADEFEYLKKSVTFGGEHRFFNFPHRFHLDIEAKNFRDYFGDINYSYEDTVVLRGMVRGLYHNLDNVRLIDLDPASTAATSPRVQVNDLNMGYGLKFNMSNVFMRFKTHDFPFHVYIDGTYLVKDGWQQQRFLGGTGGNSNIIRTSSARDVDWKTQNIVLGLNSHLGPVEVDLSHIEKRFDVGGTGVFFDPYTAITGNTPRAAGEYPHNLIPQLKGSTNTLKLHTSYTGRIVATATLSKQDRENRSSGAKSSYFIGQGDIVWTASPQLMLVLKYRHKELDIENPATVTITDRLSSANSYTYHVERSVTSISDNVNSTLKYRPFKGVSLKAEYDYTNISRNNVDVFKIAKTTQKHVATLGTDLRIIKGVHLSAKYLRKEISSPAYNIEPDSSDEGRVALSWIPLPAVTTQLNYSLSRDKRKDLHFLETSGNITRGEKRNADRDRLMGVITVGVLKNLSVSGSYSYMQNKIRQDVEYHDATGVPYIDPFVPYKDRSHIYTLDATYAPAAQVTLTAGLVHTVTSGAFYPNSTVLLQPVSVASFSELKVRETVATASGEYRLRHGLTVGVQYRYSEVRDALANMHDDVNSGKSHIAILTLAKKW